jgi:hypothetical protein
MPRHQRLFVWAGWVLGGLLAVGTFFDAIMNAVQLITRPVSLIGTLVLLAAWGGIELLLRRRGIDWRLNSGVTVRLQRLGDQPRLALCGAVLLLWVPHFLRVEQGTTAGQRSSRTATAEKVPVAPASVQKSHGAQSPNVSGIRGDVVIQYGVGATERGAKLQEKRP